MRKCVVLIGPPCSGKSTLGKAISQVFDCKYVSSGDLAREMAKEDGSISNLNAGKMAPEDRMRDKIYDALKDSSQNIILDGFPRFIDQYEWLIDNDLRLEFIFVIVDASINELFYRVVQRGRADDVAIRERMDYYMEHTIPMIMQIRKNIQTINICSNNSIDNTTNELVCALRSII